MAQRELRGVIDVTYYVVGSVYCPVCNKICKHVNRWDDLKTGKRYDCSCGAHVYVGGDHRFIKKFLNDRVENNHYSYCKVEVDRGGNITRFLI